MTIEHDGQEHAISRPRERSLLCVLLLARGRPVSVDHLVELLWAGNPPERSRATIHTYVSRLRGALRAVDQVPPVATLIRHGDSYSIDVDADRVDALRFMNMVESARASRDAPTRAHVLREALALWRGAPGSDISPPELRDRVVGRLDELRVCALRMYFEAEIELGEHDTIIGQLGDLAAECPFDEHVTFLLMQGLFRSGRRTEALEVYRQLHARMKAELGLDPSGVLADLHSAILRNEIKPLTWSSQASRPVRRAGRVRPAQLPAPIPGFAGRVEQLRNLDEALPPGVVIISGTAGVGKTSLVLHWAHGNASRFPDGQLFVDLRGFDQGGNVMSATEALRVLLDAVEARDSQTPADIDAQIGLYRSTLAERRMLVILDNARDADQVRQLLPNSAGSLTLITSRDELTGLVVTAGAMLLTLDRLSTAEASQLLESRIGRDRVAADARHIDQIIEGCARLPLALAVVAARISMRPRLSLGYLANELSQANALHAFEASDHATDIRSVFSWSYRELAAPAARLFRLLGGFWGSDISSHGVASLVGLAHVDASEILEELRRVHLIEEPTAGRIAVHDLLRAYACELAIDAEQREAALRMLDYYVRTAFDAALKLHPHRDQITLSTPASGVIPRPISDHDSAMAWFASERAVLHAAVRYAADHGYGDHAWRIAWSTTTFLGRRGQWHDLARCQEIALDAARQTGTREGQSQANRLLGLAYMRLGRLDKALGRFRDGLEYSAAEGDLRGTGIAHTLTAQTLTRMRDFDGALTHAKASLHCFIEVGDRFNEASALNNIGAYHAELGNFDEALDSCRKALPLFHDVGAPQGEAATWDTIAYIHQRRGEHAEAVSGRQAAVRLYQQARDALSHAESLVSMSESLHAMGNDSEAQAALRSALSILEDIGHSTTEAVRLRLRPNGLQSTPSEG